MKKYILRSFRGFLMSALISMVCLLLIEAISTMLGHEIKPMTPEFISYFPSETIALETDILLYGIFGAAFSGMSFIFENERIGFVLQYAIYCITTSVIWIPIITFIWQLWKYPSALLWTIGGFVLTYGIMVVVAYRSTQKNINELNAILNELRK